MQGHNPSANPVHQDALQPATQPADSSTGAAQLDGKSMLMVMRQEEADVPNIRAAIGTAVPALETQGLQEIKAEGVCSSCCKYANWKG
eukprot:scaffold223637_cov15-Tisochrysis_lutea.AAC.1